MPLFFRQSLRPRPTAMITHPIPKVISNTFLNPFNLSYRPKKTFIPPFQNTQNVDADKASKEAQLAVEKKKTAEALNNSELYAERPSAGVYVRVTDRSYYPNGYVIDGKEFEEGVKETLKKARKADTGYY